MGWTWRITQSGLWTCHGLISLCSRSRDWPSAVCYEYRSEFEHNIQANCVICHLFIPFQRQNRRAFRVWAQYPSQLPYLPLVYSISKAEQKSNGKSVIDSRNNTSPLILVFSSSEHYRIFVLPSLVANDGKIQKYSTHSYSIGDALHALLTKLC